MPMSEWRERFWAKVNKDGPVPAYRPGLGPCWIWTGAKYGGGYGRVVIGGRNKAAHRMSYEDSKGVIPDSLTVDHLCRVPACVNPAHLEAVTNLENILRGDGQCVRNARKTHCSRGHEFTPENTRMRGTERQCRTCRLYYKHLARKRTGPPQKEMP